VRRIGQQLGDGGDGVGRICHPVQAQLYKPALFERAAGTLHQFTGDLSRRGNRDTRQCLFTSHADLLMIRDAAFEC